MTPRGSNWKSSTSPGNVTFCETSYFALWKGGRFLWSCSPIPSRLGTFFLGGEAGHIIRLYLPGDPTPRIAEHETPVLSEARRQLLEYLAGRRTAFSLPLAPEGGTPFQRQVWRALEAIPFGETRTYGQIAAAVGSPKAVRAVGQANHRNPIPIFIPCHRVVGADGP